MGKELSLKATRTGGHVFGRLPIYSLSCETPCPEIGKENSTTQRVCYDGGEVIEKSMENGLSCCINPNCSNGFTLYRESFDVVKLKANSK